METKGVGFFGKLPTLGDFVSRRLPRQFIDPWDQWLQSSLRVSQDIHGENWLSLFLVSPFWRFAISPGICGDAAWAGVMMPSVDRVGRYYPLTLAQTIDPSQMAGLFLPDSRWFSELESAALSVLDEPFELDSFDHSLLNIAPPKQSSLQCFPFQNGQSATSSKIAFRYDLQSLDQTVPVFSSLTQSLLSRILQSYSFWATEDIQQGNAQFLCFDGMPPIDAYAGFLKGLPVDSANFCPIPPVLPPIREDAQEGNEPTLPRAQLAQASVSAGSWQSHGITEVGNRRKHNEDAMLDAPEKGLWIVADGMGGHQSGDMASRRIVDGLAAMPSDIDLSSQVEWLRNSLQEINDDLCRIANQMHEGAVVGSTVVALLAKGRECAAIWAGDSRLYRLRGGQFKQLTHDHTLLDELLSTSNMNREEAIQYVGANVITRAVGGQQTLELDVIRFEAESGDRYLLCSDGLDKELAESEIAEGLAAASCHLAVQGLIDTALQRNAIDNITVIVVEYV